MVKEAILKAITHTTLILFMGLVALLPLHLLLQQQVQLNTIKTKAYQQQLLE